MSELGGDFDEDDQVAGKIDSWAGSAGGGVWTPDCWHTSPDGLIAQARAKNEDGWRGAFASAGRGSQPPAYSADHELSA
jgi:hypothetical protein